MGIDLDLLPVNHQEAGQLHDAFIDSGLAIEAGYSWSDTQEIFSTYDNKSLPNRSEYLGLLSWVPSYLLLQVPRMHNWVPFVTMGTVSLLKSAGNSIASRWSGTKKD